jgi:putative phosphoribosyl transferase
MSPEPDEADPTEQHREEVRIAVDGDAIVGDLVVPHGARGVVAFAHGSGSSRHSSRNRQVAERLASAGFATLLMDLLTPGEEQVDLRTRQHRFDIDLLAGRVAATVDWLRADGRTRDLPVGLFGASTGAGAALVAAGRRPDLVGSVVSRGGRPDLAGDALPTVRAPTLLIVGGADRPVIGMNEDAMARMTCPVELTLVAGATHLFEEPGALEQVADLAVGHLERTLGPGRQRGVTNG